MIQNNQKNNWPTKLNIIKIKDILALVLPALILASINFDRAMHENTIDAIENGRQNFIRLTRKINKHIRIHNY
jgi:hypothetical protein